MTDSTRVPNEFMVQLRRMAVEYQDYQYFSGGDSVDYDLGYESGRRGAGDELESLLRLFGFWSEE